MSLLSACDSAILIGYCSQLSDLYIRYRHLAGRIKSNGPRNVGAEHEKILQASIDRDAEQACALLVSHYQKTGDLIAERLSE